MVQLPPATPAARRSFATPVADTTGSVGDAAAFVVGGGVGDTIVFTALAVRFARHSCSSALGFDIADHADDEVFAVAHVSFSEFPELVGGTSTRRLSQSGLH